MKIRSQFFILLSGIIVVPVVLVFGATIMWKISNRQSVVVPDVKTDPGACEREVYAIGPSQLSIAVGSVHVTFALHVPGFVPWFISEGHPVITGSSSSVMVISNEQFELLPCESVNTYVTVVVPVGNVAPGA